MHLGYLYLTSMNNKLKKKCFCCKQKRPKRISTLPINKRSILKERQHNQSLNRKAVKGNIRFRWYRRVRTIPSSICSGPAELEPTRALCIALYAWFFPINHQNLLKITTNRKRKETLNRLRRSRLLLQIGPDFYKATMIEDYGADLETTRDRLVGYRCDFHSIFPQFCYFRAIGR